MASVMSCHAMQCNAKVPRIAASVCVDEKERDGENFLRVGDCGLLVGKRMKHRVCGCWWVEDQEWRIRMEMGRSTG